MTRTRIPVDNIRHLSLGAARFLLALLACQQEVSLGDEALLCRLAGIPQSSFDHLAQELLELGFICVSDEEQSIFVFNLPVIPSLPPAKGESALDGASSLSMLDKTGAMVPIVQGSRGACQLCQAQINKEMMVQHLAACVESKKEKSSGRVSRKFHVLVESQRLPHYWLHLEISQQCQLITLDRFLRRIWLECCGHLSAFEISGVRYSIDAGMYAEEWDEDIPEEHTMNTQIRRVLSPGQQFFYEYDYGSTTRLSLQIIATYDGEAGRHPVRLLARNDPPPIWCFVCSSQLATLVCTQCIDDHYHGQYGWVCQRCAQDHECGTDMLLPVVNSPRTGVCGYIG